MRAVVLVIALAEFALVARTDLSSDTDAVANFDVLNLGSYAHSFAHDFMAEY